MLIDGATVPDGDELRFDVCIVGAGPAGLSLAAQLEAEHLKVVLLEAGGVRPRVRDQQMLRGEVQGAPYWPLENVRSRMFGGSGNRWGAICRPLDPIDFQVRPWVADSGWPITNEELGEHYPRAAQLLGVEGPDFARPSDTSADSFPEIGDLGLNDIHYRISTTTDYASTWLDPMRRSRTTTVVTGANVTRLASDEAGAQVRLAHVATHGGRRFTVAAGAYVLAAGGIENARLMLLSQELSPSGLGDPVIPIGRYFIEHLHVPIALMEPSPVAVGWSSYLTSSRHHPKLIASLTPSAKVQEDAQLVSASLAIGPWWYGGAPPLVDRDARIAVAAERAYRVLARRGDGEVRWPARLVEGSRAAWSRRSARAAWASGLPEPELSRTIVYRGEQRPSAENRVLLGSARDRLGNPLATLRWNIDERDLANAPAVLTLLTHASETLGWGSVIGPGPQWRTAVTGGPHHMGTTRMSLDPRRGVVDRDCRVHGTSNLYAAGSSVFATGGHANPTFTIVALAVRLGAHLSARFRGGGLRS